MKTKGPRFCFLALSLLVTALSATAGRPRVLSYAGSQTNLGSDWRTPGVSKPLDIDGDNVLGTDGYYLVNLTQVLPGYVSAAGILTSTYLGNDGYYQMDDPTNPPGLFTTGTMNPFPGPGTNADIFQFILNGNAAGRRIRVGLLVDNLDIAAYNAASLTLVRNAGVGGETNGPIATASAIFNDRNPDWVFFDITDAVAGDTFIIRGAGGIYGAATLGGVVFDSINVVTSIADSGPGALRTILAALPAGSTVGFALNPSGATILLTSGALTVNTSVTIDASTAPGGITIDGNHASKIFQVNAGTVALTGLTLTNGFDSNAFGGCISNRSALTLNRCTLAGNSSAYGGGAVYNAAALTINRCTLAANSSSTAGGAIYNDGTLTVNTSMLTGNSTGVYGGGIYTHGPVTLNNSTLSGNSSTNGPGGGISTSGNTTETLNQCTLSGNSASGGGGIYIDSDFDVLTLNQCTLAGNSAYTGGGILNYGFTFLFNSIVATNNASAYASDILNYSSLTYSGVNIVQNVLDDGGSSGTGRIYLAPNLAPLGNYGGPTLTMPPLLGSPAIDAGSDAVTNTTDQRGFPRLADLHADIGAVEVQPATAATLAASDVTATAATVNGAITAGDLTNTWYFEYGPTTNYGLISLTTTLNPGYTPTSVSVALASLNPATTYHFRILDNDGIGVKSGGDMTFTTQASAAAAATLAATDVYGATATLNGTINPAGLATQYYFTYVGAAAGSSNLYTATNTLPAGNADVGVSANLVGLVPGASYSYQIVASNSLGISFGALFNFICGGVAVVTDGSDAVGHPGSLRGVVNSASSGDTITFTNTLSGATLRLLLGPIYLTKNLAIDASALSNGIAINGNNASNIFQVIPGATVLLNQLTITNGATIYFGGGIYSAGTLTLNQCTLAGNAVNSSDSGGGAIANTGVLTLNQCTLTANSAGAWGGIYNFIGGTVTLNQCTLAANSAGTTGGGGIYNGYGTVTLNQCTVSGNSAFNGPGGGVAGAPSAAVTLNVLNSIVAGNTESFGFDIYLVDGASLNFSGANVLKGSPQLAALGNYGGPTQTMPPLPGSPAIDGCATGIDPSLTADQRGFPRVVGLYADIGAVEGVYNSSGPGILAVMNRAANDPASFNFTNFTDMSFTALATTNIGWPLNLWSNLGAVVESPVGSGHYEFTDLQATNSLQRFYRVRSP